MDVYLRHSTLPVEENQTRELKGHRCISQEEVNPRFYVKDPQGNSTKCTRQCVSKYLCGMINSGKGGTIYCGVLDNGQVEGFMLTPYQRDHVVLAIRDTFNR